MGCGIKGCALCKMRQKQPKRGAPKPFYTAQEHLWLEREQGK
jgi:hypothetical protein